MSADLQDTIRHLQAFCNELWEFTHKLFEPMLKATDDDHIATMAIVFTAKQAEHLASVQYLVEGRRYPDASTLARVMVEGMALLLWANREPNRRARDWRAYALVVDLHTLRDRQTASQDIPSRFEDELLSRLPDDASQFLKEDGDPRNPADYKSKWHLDDQGRPVRVIDILRDLGDPRIVQLYGDLSQWIH